jgi:hypothetical protein
MYGRTRAWSPARTLPHHAASTVAQTLLINLSVSLGLMSVAVLVTDYVMMSCCPLRNIYKQYKVR